MKTFRRSLSPTGPAVRALLDGPASLVADVAGGGISTEEEATTPCTVTHLQSTKKRPPPGCRVSTPPPLPHGILFNQSSTEPRGRVGKG